MTTPARIGVTLRHGELVSPLELFFDLVFVLATGRRGGRSAMPSTFVTAATESRREST